MEDWAERSADMGEQEVLRAYQLNTEFWSSFGMLAIKIINKR